MQYSNFEENPEVRLPSDVCESVREEISSRAAHLTRYNSEFEGSVSSTQNPQSSNPQSPTHSDGTRASTKSTSLPHSSETGIMPLFFFSIAIPVFCHTAFYGTFRSAVFSIPIFLVPLPSQVMRRGSGALSPATHAHSTSHSQTYTTTFIHPWAPFPDGTRTRADLAVVAERVLILPSTTLPSAPRRHTHTSMARRRFLPLKKSSPFGGIRTH
jgi:hypothetical protein